MYIIANHGSEPANFLSDPAMKERIDENHQWVTDDGTCTDMKNMLLR